MANRARSFVGTGILGAVLALSLVGCGGGSAEPAAGETTQQEAATQEAEETEESASIDPMSALIPHENDYLSIGVAGGWAEDPESDENEHFLYEDSSGYSYTLQYDDESLQRRSFIVTVYDKETYNWAEDYSTKLPEESDHMREIEALDPITIDGVELYGFRSENTTMDGQIKYHYAYYGGTVNGHYVDMFLVDSSDDNMLLSDMIRMCESVHVK